MTTNDEERMFRYLEDLDQLATDIPQGDLFVVYTQQATTLKILAASNGVPVETIQKFEKSAIKSIAADH
jgi:hypothetical protein